MNTVDKSPPRWTGLWQRIGTLQRRRRAGGRGAAWCVVLVALGVASVHRAIGADAPAPSTMPSAAAVPYTLAADGRVSMVLCGQDGRIVRELLHAAPRAAGAHAEPWDGLDEKGQPVAAGTYTWKLLSTQGLTAEYLVTLGTKTTPAWTPWPGNHGTVSSAAVGPDGATYFGSSCSEGPPALVRLNADGKQAWSLPWQDSWVGPISMAVDGERLYWLQQDTALRSVDAATGDKVTKASVRWDEKTPEPNKPDLDNTEWYDMAVAGGRAVVSYARHDAVRWIDPATGRVLGEAKVPQPAGVAVARDGRVLVASGNAILAITPPADGTAAGTPTPFIDGLDTPYRLDVDRVTGDILVAERGKSQQVRRFTAQGRPVRAYGTPGGRPPQGRYEPSGFINPTDIAADGAGGFLLTEHSFHAPRRTAHIGPDGNVIREWYGGQMYANPAAVDPEDPTLVWIASSFQDVIQAKVDYANRTWTVLATYRFDGLAAGMVSMAWHNGEHWLPRHHNGRTFLCREGRPIILEVDEAGRRLIPRSVYYNAFVVWKDTRPAVVRDAMNRLGLAESSSPQLLWTDANGDGQTTADEIVEVKTPVWGSRAFILPDLSYVRAFLLQPPGDRHSIYANRVTGWRDGTPTFEWGDAVKPAVRDELPAEFVDGGVSPSGVAIDPTNGNTFAANNLSNGTRFGIGPAGERSGSRLVAWGSDGRLRWVVGRHAAGSVAAPGEVKVFNRVIGTANGCVAATDYADSMIHVWDADGLWVGRLLDQPMQGGAPREAYQVCGENFGGSLYQVPAEANVPGLKAGDVLFFGGGDNATPVFRITGWDAFARQSGTVTLSPERQATLVARAEAEAARPGVVSITPIDRVVIDGDLKEWADRPPTAIIKDGADERARVYLAARGQWLYAAFDVTTDRPWKNASTPTFAFRGGAAVDVGVAGIGEDKTPLSPERVVVAPIGNRTTAVRFVPVIPASKDVVAGTDLGAQTYETTLGRVTFERVKTLNRDWSAAREKPGGGGYTIELQFPLPAGVDLRPGVRLRVNASVILADPTGTHSVARIPAFGNDRGDTVTNDVFTEAQLRPTTWAEAIVR